MLNFLIRTFLFLTGLALAAAAAGVVLLLAAAWTLRSGWLRLTGRPVAPWAMRFFDPRAGFGRFGAGPFAAAATAARPAAGAHGRARRGPFGAGEAATVTDVVARPVER